MISNRGGFAPPPPGKVNLKMAQFAGNYQAEIAHKPPLRQRERRSYEFRKGQVERILVISSRITTYDIAREIGISPRQAFNLCKRMLDEQRITVEQVKHANHFKWLISGRPQ